jgi:septal ring factor EnvC (AmiA/AmiB activator)
MWPKAFAQLVELAPHISRLLPMADRFFQNKAAGEDANRSALETLSEGVRDDLAEIAARHAEMNKQVHELLAKMDDVTTDVRASTLAAESIERRLTQIEARQNRTSVFFGIAFVLLAAVLVLLGILLARH